MNKFRKKGFTLLESLFSLLILSIISMVFVLGIYQISKNKENNLKIVNEINEVQNIFEKIKFNISQNKIPLENINSNFEIKIKEFDELIYVNLKTKNEKGEVYEVYFKK